MVPGSGLGPSPLGLPGQGRAGWDRDEGLVARGDFLKPREQTLLSWHALLLRCSAHQASDWSKFCFFLQGLRSHLSSYYTCRLLAWLLLFQEWNLSYVSNRRL